jgi:hypothetical protein
MHRSTPPARRRVRARCLPNGTLRIEQLETRRVCAASSTLLLVSSNTDDARSLTLPGPGSVPGAPGQPTAVVAASSGGRVTLSWSAPANDGGSAIFDYQAQYKPTMNSDESYTTFTDGVSAATWMTITGLTVGTSYTFRVLAQNKLGVGTSSTPSEPMTVRQGPYTAPSAPFTLGAMTISGQSILSWRAPFDDGGVPIHDYWVQYKLVGQPDSAYVTLRDWISGATSTTVTGLPARQQYTVRVFAQNKIGISEPSATTTMIIASRTAPFAPTSLSATTTKGTVTLSWNAPTDDGNSAIYDYWVQYKLTGQSDATYTTFRDGESAMTRMTVTELAPGRSFTFRVLAQNRIGVSAASATTTLTVAPWTVPSAPFSLTGFGRNGGVELEWRIPIDSGGPSTTDYWVQYKLTGQPDSTYTTFPGLAWFPSDPIRKIFTGLAGDTSYTFRVFAQNSMGLSEPSATCTLTTAPHVKPGSPNNLGGYSSSGAMNLYWTAPDDDGGSAIYDYWLQYKLASEADAMYVTFSDGLSGATTMTVPGLTVGMSYTFRVFAQNRVGVSNASLSWTNIVPIA